jgi:hypothetical protein
MIAKHLRGLGSPRREVAAAGPDAAGSPKAGPPTAKGAANQDEKPALVLSAKTRAESADKLRGD